MVENEVNQWLAVVDTDSSLVNQWLIGGWSWLTATDCPPHDWLILVNQLDTGEQASGKTHG